MIDFLKLNKTLSLTLLVSILFFLKKGIAYAVIGSFVPLWVITSIIVLLALSIQKRKKFFIIILRTWAIVLIIWAITRTLISIIHLTIKPFDGSYHTTQQLGSNSLFLSIVMMVLGILMFRNSNKKRIKDLL